VSRWLVTYVPSWLLLIGLIVVVAGGAALVQKFVRRRYPALIEGEHNDVTKFTYGFIGFLYAFFIGFVVSSMWGQINAADTSARAEGAVAVQMATLATVFDKADSDRVRKSLLTYERAAIDEWPSIGDARSPQADNALAAVFTAYQQVHATTDPQKSFLATSYTDFNTISQARTERLLTAREDAGPPWPIWVVIFLTSAMVVGTVIIYGVEKPVMHYPMVAIVGVIVATNLFLILQLAHPFIGDISTSSDPLQEVVMVLSPSPGQG
jgi:hypothetical protein